jgi:CRISPR system Cascade subunit CasA
MLPLNLLQAPWLPVRRASGRGRIGPHGLTDDLKGDAVLDLDWPRADFRIACLELLIGLLATACPPEDEDTWTEWWHHPPSPDILAEKFAPLANAFVLDGDGPRFCQDLEDLTVKPVPIEWLLIDGPGENTIALNTDLIVKRDSVLALGRPAAAMGLYTLQAFASGGGGGYRVSLRGGGPLTTLVKPPQIGNFRTLWHLLWANVPNGQPPLPEEMPKVFPWLAPTRSSEGDVGTVLGSSDAHPMQAFWGMPRRMRLDFLPTMPGQVCGLTGTPDAVVARTFRRQKYGVKYENSVQFHPLTPTHRLEAGGPLLAVRAKLDRVGYRAWHQFVSQDPAAKDNPAAAVSNFIGRSPLAGAGLWPEARLLLGGYEMNKATARCFIETEMPLFIIENDDLRRGFLMFSRRLAEGATKVAELVSDAVRRALPRQKTNREAVEHQFSSYTEAAFWVLLRDILQSETFRSSDELIRLTSRLAMAQEWHNILRTQAFNVFKSAAPLDPLAPGSAGTIVNGKRISPPIVEARRNLGRSLAGYGKDGNALYQILALEPPEKKPAKPKPEKPRKAARNG